MIGMLEFATEEGSSVWALVREFAIEMSVGLAVGAAGAAALLPLMRRVALPREALYPIRTLAFAGVIFGVATVAHGSGFLAVFVAGLLIGDSRAPYKGEIERFHTSLASLAEMAVFTVLGLTIDITELGADGVWLDGLLLALILAFVARPIVVGSLLLPARLRYGERVFIAWGGLKGAVPILLGTLALLEQVAEAERIYQIVFVVITFSVLVQGTSIPFAARRLQVPMRVAEPRGVQRFVVAMGSRAAGEAVRNLPISERTWIQAVVREGRPIAPDGHFVLRPGDEVALILDVEDATRLEHLFSAPRGYLMA